MTHVRTLILALVIAALIALLAAGWAWDDVAPLAF